jgi:hypothetical protein
MGTFSSSQDEICGLKCFDLGSGSACPDECTDLQDVEGDLDVMRIASSPASHAIMTFVLEKELFLVRPMTDVSLSYKRADFLKPLNGHT